MHNKAVGTCAQIHHILGDGKPDSYLVLSEYSSFVILGLIIQSLLSREEMDTKLLPTKIIENVKGFSRHGFKMSLVAGSGNDSQSTDSTSCGLM